MNRVNRHKRGNPLPSTDREIIRNVFRTLKTENSGITVKDIATKAAESTGVCRANVFNILKEFRAEGKNYSKCKCKIIK